MASMRTAGRMFCAAAQAAATPAPSGRWERLRRSKAGRERADREKSAELQATIILDCYGKQNRLSDLLSE